MNGAAILAAQRPRQGKRIVETLTARQAMHHAVRFFPFRGFRERCHPHEIDALPNVCASRSARSASSDDLRHTGSVRSMQGQRSARDSSGNSPMSADARRFTRKHIRQRHSGSLPCPSPGSQSAPSTCAPHHTPGAIRLGHQNAHFHGRPYLMRATHRAVRLRNPVKVQVVGHQWLMRLSGRSIPIEAS